MTPPNLFPNITTEVAVPAHAQVGEGPVWDNEREVLWWVDIPQGLVHASSFGAEPSTVTAALNVEVGAIALTAGPELVVASAHGFGILETGSYQARTSFLAAGQRMNDAKCDAAGRLWAGSTARDFRVGAGAVHVLHPDWTHHQALEDLILPNGLAWSPESSSFYLADSIAGIIYAFDYDLDAATLSRQRVLISFPRNHGMPDGLCVDSDGCLWVAMWGGGSVLRISPTGQLLTTIPMPVLQPSSCAFGGPNLDVLYVSTAAAGVPAPADHPALDGSVFAVTGTGATGTPTMRFAGSP